MENAKIKFSKDSLFRKTIAKTDGYIHFIAIGGIGMSALAKILIELGYKVSGTYHNKRAIIYIFGTVTNFNDSTGIFYGFYVSVVF